MFPRDGENSIYTNVLTAVNCFENKQTLNLNLKLTTLILQGGISMIRMPLSIICTWMRNILETQMMMGEISILCKCPLTYSDPHPNHPYTPSKWFSRILDWVIYGIDRRCSKIKGMVSQLPRKWWPVIYFPRTWINICLFNSIDFKS